ncbi:MAG: biotin holocarboxylase synthetase [Heterodermia speciosa]|uniref:Biotin holocarboxylase synthetase n=1 Tax=Heterodermia speciosa TaxID=116794 RepID=A0A8H3IHT3_9LECA|nr:MAG: biotin holocarboxylase synthetase [Heterodermia speciosa]
MATKRMNVLVYSGNGSTVESIRHCLYSLRRLLSPSYAVITVTGEAIIKEPWTPSCALLVFPGGADLGYCRTLNGEGNRRIRQYVERGGLYLGLCAGGYYGSQRCEFELGRKNMEVAGNRELAFYPGTCRGCAFPGFVYHSEKGTKAAEVAVSKTALTKGSIPTVFRAYYNGGGIFVDAPKYQDQGVEVLASYTEDICVDAGEGRAAVVYCRVGEGAAILTSNHPEFAAVNLDKNADIPGFDKVVDALTEDDPQRTDFLKACLWKLGLEVNQEQNVVPSLSRLHLSSILPSYTSELMASLADIITTEDGKEYIQDENDRFCIERMSTWSFGSVANALPTSGSVTAEEEADQDRILDYSKITKHIVIQDQQVPQSKETPYFNHHAFFANLEYFQSRSTEGGDAYGKHLLYGEVVTSTNTILEKNTHLLRRLPSGFTATATVQVAGRGRGSNVWVSPAGSLIFSTVVRHPMSLMPHAPVVFLQYLAAMAIVEGIKDYDAGYQNVPIKLKWPNDIYALDPADSASKTYVKIGGILVNSHYSSEEYLSVIGIGLNTTNASPTTSLNALKPPAPFTLEKLLARILTSFSDLYARFVRTGFDKDLEGLYYKHWLHMDQIVTLETEGGARARIKGITRDWGLLIAEELGFGDRATGRIITLQSDSNSFDFFKGLVKRKV